MLEETKPGDEKSLIEDLKQLGKNVVPDISGALSDVYQNAVKLNEVFGQNKERLTEIQRTIFDIRPEIAALGGKMSDVFNVLEGVSKATSRNVLITAQDAKELYATGKVLGEYTESMVRNYTEVGIQVSKIKDEAEKAVNYVQSMGLNTKDVMSLVRSNFEKLNEFNFSSGVEGMAKMAANATMFKFDMNQTFKLANDALDPQKAVNLASAFQRMGVAVGDLTDPFQLMYKSLNDPEGLQESLSQMTKKFSYFDEKTKTFKIAPEGLLQMRELSQQTGISYESLSKSALAAANMDKALSQIKPGIKFESEDDKRMLANIARMGKGGEYEVKLKGQDEAVKLSELTQEQIKELLEEQRNTPKTIEETAMASLNLEEKLNADVAAIRQKLEGYVGSQPMVVEGVTQIDKILAGIGTEAKNIFPDVPESRKFVRDLVSDYRDAIQQVMSGKKLSEQQIKEAKEKIENLGEKIVEAGGKKFEGATQNISSILGDAFKDYKKYGMGIESGKKVFTPKKAETNINTKVDMGGTVTFKVDAGPNVNTSDLERYVNSNDFRKKFYEILLNMDQTQRTNLKQRLGI